MRDINAKVSIIMPVYNVARYLPQAMESVLGQTLSEIEVICGDGGSTDGSLELLRRYEMRDSRVRVISRPGSGYGQSMNECIHSARGEYIGIVETDDFVSSEMYRILYEEAVKAGADIIKSDFRCFVGDGKGRMSAWTVRIGTSRKYYRRVFTPREEPCSFRCCMNTWCGLYRRSFLERYGIEHNETPGGSYQDNGFWFQTFALAEKVVLLPKAFYYYRQDNPNASVRNREKAFCACDEYDFIREQMQRFPDVWERVEGAYWVARLGACTHTLGRIAPEYREMLMERMRSDFSAMLLPETEYRTVFSGRERRLLEAIRCGPQDAAKRGRQSLGDVLVGGYWCVREHGWGYTWSRLKGKIVCQSVHKKPGRKTG